jgi:hypothetical protein
MESQASATTEPATPERANRFAPLQFILAFGLVSGLGDVVYEGALVPPGPAARADWFRITSHSIATAIGTVMSTRFVKKITPERHGDVLTAISDGMVGLQKEFYGRGPTRTKSYYEDDLVVCLLRGGFSRVEQTLLEGGRGPSVIQQEWTSRT